MIRPFEVTVIVDATIRPPGPKMVVAIDPSSGFYYRINTKPWRPAVLLPRLPDHPWLDHDSWLECGDPLELDDYTIEQALRRRGVIGRLSRPVCAEIRQYVVTARSLSQQDKDLICRSINEFLS